MMMKKEERQGNQGNEHPQPHRPTPIHEKSPLMQPESPKTTKESLIREIEENNPQGGIWAEPGLAESVRSIPDTVFADRRAGNFRRAIVEFPNDVRVLLQKGKRTSVVVKNVRDLLEDAGEFSFCVHPLTGHAFVADTETGHKKMKSQNGVFGDMEERFCIGEVGGSTGSVQPAKIPGMTDKESCDIVRDMLTTEYGVPAAGSNAVKFKYDIPIEAATTVHRGFTPGGKEIPEWAIVKKRFDAPSSHSPGGLFPSQADMENMSRREAEIWYEARMAAERAKEAPAPVDPHSFVVYEKDPTTAKTYCYTKFPIVAIGGLHARAVMPLNHTPGIAKVQVFNSGKNQDSGLFTQADLTTLGDGPGKKTTASSPTRTLNNKMVDLGHLIVRVESREGVIPEVFTAIERTIMNTRQFGDMASGYVEETKGD